MAARDQICVPPLPADSRQRGDRLLHQRCGVDEHLDLGTAGSLQGAGHTLELRLDDLVVIAALRIDRDGAAPALRQHRQRIATGRIGEAEHNRGPGLRPHPVGMRPPVGGCWHPVHFAMAASGEEGGKPLARHLTQIIEAGNAGAVEAGGRRLGLDQCSEIGQGSEIVAHDLV